MSKKTVREMNAAERAHHSLAARVFHASLMGSVVLGAVTLLIGLGLYTRALVGQYIDRAVSVAPSAAMSARHGVDSVSIVREVMRVYRGLSPEERAKTGTPEYRALFSHVESGEDFDRLVNILRGYANSGDINDVYLAMYDRENSALVYIADPDRNPDTAFAPGEWESVSAEEIEKFLDWDGTGELYDISREKKYGWMCTAGVPMQDENGETIAFVLTDVTLETVAVRMKSFTLQFTFAILFVTALVACLAARHMKRAAVEPINAIADAAERYAADKVSGSGKTGHFEELQIRTGDEIENLGLVMANMEHDLADFEEKLTRGRGEGAHRHGTVAGKAYSGGYAAEHLPTVPGAQGV